MSKLHEILEDQLAQARAEPGRKIVRRLGGKLQIELACITSNVYLTLVRYDQDPSLDEWETITKHFPYQLPKVLPAYDRQGPRRSITARFQSQSTMQLKY